MSSMSIQELYDYLNSPEFQNVKNGNIFYNYYIYQYPAKRNTRCGGSWSFSSKTWNAPLALSMPCCWICSKCFAIILKRNIRF